MVYLWGYRSIFLVLLVSVAASLLALNALHSGEKDVREGIREGQAPAVRANP
jgi:hypothetical protein